MNKAWLMTAAVGLVLTAALSEEASGFGLARRDCAPPCPPPPPIQVILEVCHPCTGCKYEVPVCVPACCTDTPCVHFERTLIGYGKTVFEWQSGHRVIVRYPPGGGYRVIERG
jgi:hypothetical protein